MQNNLAVISLSEIINNARLLQAVAGVPLYAVVKDNAYGHGAEQVALGLQPHVKGFAVATVAEGAALKIAGVSSDVLVLTPPLCEEEAMRALSYGLILSVNCFSALRLIGRAAQTVGVLPRAHLAVNTGMNRLGFRRENLVQACREAQREGFAVEGVYSHLYAAEDAKARKKQVALFSAFSEEVRRFFPQAERHIAATGGTIAGDASFDAVRCGIGLYGYLPQGFEGALPLKPAMKVYTYTAQRGTFTGGGVGYAKAKEPYRRLHTLRLGYGDGLFREGLDIAVGKLCMDACICEGDSRFARRRIAVPDITAYARAHGTTEYEVLVRIAARADKVYV